jgi:amidase
MNDAVATWSAARLAEAIRVRELSSRELLDIFLDRIERLNPPINAVVTLDVERAQRAAAAADERVARGDALGSLHGLPVTIKDAIETEGLRSTGGATELTDHVPAADAPAVARLKDAGAIVFGKTNLPRWSGDAQTYNEMFGTTNNPWHVERVPGGSSGGAAAAVACGFTSFELGTDIGGSIRMPSHFCGVYGLKPSHGIISQRGYLDHVGGGTTDADINVFGPIARSADDLDLLLGVLAGPEPDRAVAWRLDLPPAKGTTLADYRIGVWLDDDVCRIARDYHAVLANMVDQITDAGAKVEEAHPPVDAAEQLALFSHRIAAAVSPSMDDDVAEAIAGSHAAWLRSEEHRARLRGIWAEWFDDFDILLCPVNTGAAFPHNQEGDILTRTIDVDGIARPMLDVVAWPGLIGIMGLPSAVSPIGRTAENMPVGVQVVSPSLHDRRSVRVARLISEVVGGYEPPPGFAA